MQATEGDLLEVLLWLIELMHTENLSWFSSAFPSVPLRTRWPGQNRPFQKRYEAIPTKNPTNKPPRAQSSLMTMVWQEVL